MKYKGVYICRVNGEYRVKADPADHHALHRGSFDSSILAEEWVDRLGAALTKKPYVPRYGRIY